ncbi:hypothetical protein VTO42DRAFT_2505 [Malbranchea cinnamomea]
MDPEPCSEDPSGIRSVELTTQDTQHGNRDLAVDLRVEFTGKPGSNLRVLDLGKGFEVSIQHQLVYQIEGTYDHCGRSYARRTKLSDASSSDKLAPSDVLTDERHASECSKNSQEATPRKVCTRETVLTPEPTRRRLFPPSPASDDTGEDEIGVSDDEDKENKEPKNMKAFESKLAGHQYGHKREITAVRVPASSLKIHESSVNAAEFEQPKNPSRQPSIHLGMRDERLNNQIQSPSKIPVKVSKRFETPKRKPSHDVDSLLLATAPERMSLSPQKSKYRQKMSGILGRNWGSAPQHFRRKTFSPERTRSWQALLSEGKQGLDAIQKNSPRKELTSLIIRSWLQNNEQLEQIEDGPETPLRAKGRSGSPLQIKANSTKIEDERGCWTDEEGFALSHYRSPSSQESLVLPSPSTSSQLSIPWNSVEDLISKEHMSVSECARRPLAPRSLPVLAYDKGILYLTFPTDVIEGEYVCHAAIRLHIFMTHVPNITLCCSTTNLSSAFNLKWGVPYRSTNQSVSALAVSLVQPLMGIPPESDCCVSLPAGAQDNGDNKCVGELREESTKMPSSSEKRQFSESFSKLDEEGRNQTGFTEVTKHIRILSTAIWFLLHLLFSVLMDNVRYQQQRAFEFWRRHLATRRRLRWATIVLICVFLFFDEQCQLEATEPPWPVPAWYYEVNGPRQPISTSCSRWMQGRQAIKSVFVGNGAERMDIRHFYPWDTFRYQAPGVKTNIKTDKDINGGEDKDVGIEPELRCLQVRATIEGFACVLNDTHEAKIPPNALREEGFTLEGWIQSHRPDVIRITPDNTADGGEETPDRGLSKEEMLAESSTELEESVKEDVEQFPIQNKVPSLRDRIDYLLGWRGLE